MKPRRDDSTRQASQAQIAGMPVVILCGGQGTRLREHTDNVPKPMVEIGDQPILWHIMKLYGMRGFRRFILCLGYKSWVIKEYFLRYHERRRDFTVSMKGDPPAVRFHNHMGEEDWQVTCAETHGLESVLQGVRPADHYDPRPLVLGLQVVHRPAGPHSRTRGDE